MNLKRMEISFGNNKIKKECASSALEIQTGESPVPAKSSEQPVHSLGAEAVRLGLSVGSGA